MKKFDKFINERITIKQQMYLDTIVNYLKKYSDEDLYEYDEDFIIRKKGEPTLTGKLFLTESKKAVRFNFQQSFLHSIDLWDSFEFEKEKIKLVNNKIVHIHGRVCNQPSLTMMLNTTVVDGILDDIVDFFEHPDAEVFEAKKRDVGDEEFSINKSVTEDVELKSITISKEVINQNIDVFEAITYFTMQLATGKAKTINDSPTNSLIVSGLAGLGKTFEVTDALKNLNIPYVINKGDLSAAGLFEHLLKNRRKLIVFDDCNSVFDPKDDAYIILLSALDTYNVRTISRIVQTHFDVTGMSDEQIDAKYKETGKLPKEFNFDGKVIFITNVPGDKIGPAVISRSIQVDVKLNREQVLARMNKIMTKMFPQVKLSIKEEALEFLTYMVDNYKTKSPLNIRSLIHCINIRVANDFTKNIDGKTIPVWQMLIKEYLVDK